MTSPLFLTMGHVLQSANAWYDNPWVIGVVTGVASGLLLTLLTPILLRRRRAKEIADKQERAAEDALSALRPTVATGNFPSASIVQAVRRASAYNRKLDVKLAVPASDLLDVLASEVMVSSFVSPESRIALADRLLSLQSDLTGNHASPVPIEEVRADDRIVTAVSAMVGACILGAGSAISVLTKSALVIIATGILAVIALTILQLGDRLTTFRFGVGNIHLSFHAPSRERLSGPKRR